MILSDQHIKELLDSGRLVIEPLENAELQIQPASVDLRLSSEFLVYKNFRGFSEVINPKANRPLTDYATKVVVEQDKGFTLHPGQFALGSTIETVKIPVNLTARIEGRSSLGRLGVLVHATAGFIDPGFEGQITLELANLNSYPVVLYPGSRVSQIVFHAMSGASARPYGSPTRGSKYQGQTGATMSRIKDDRK